MHAAACSTLVFSSRSTVYGDPATVPITEDFHRDHTNPYGHTKLVIEDMLSALRAPNPTWRIGVLRYFNPVGALASVLIGEDPRGIPNNLMPLVAQVELGKHPHMNVYGNDYATANSTGARDYIHVQDLANGHVAALQALLFKDNKCESFTVSLGTGQGCSVLDVVRAFELASGRKVPYQIAPRRPGDVAQCYANPTLAKQLLGWEVHHTLAEMCVDTWRWQSLNPDGYR
jgi:UDP-glucose 4-epimerase